MVASACRVAPFERPKVAELARWRLKRAIDYVEARLAEPVTLADLASAAGLTRMHFAAQFRAATGLRPHEYLLRRRIERAQEMLVGTGMPVVEVALSVGFQTQSHFTSVFKRFVGQPPRAWRQLHGERNDSDECKETNDTTEPSTRTPGNGSCDPLHGIASDTAPRSSCDSIKERATAEDFVSARR
jgi:AraC-like DNA-binding protein